MPFAAADSVIVTVSVWPHSASAIVTAENGAMVASRWSTASDRAADSRRNGNGGGETVVLLSVAVAPAVSITAMVKLVVTVLARRDLMDGRREHQGVQRRGDRGVSAGDGVSTGGGTVAATAKIRQRAVRYGRQRDSHRLGLTDIQIRDRDLRERRDGYQIGRRLTPAVPLIVGASATAVATTVVVLSVAVRAAVFVSG